MKAEKKPKGSADSSVIKWLGDLTNSHNSHARRTSRNSVGTTPETLEVRSMMAGDTISAMWFEDVAGDDYERQGGAISINSDGQVEQAETNPYVNDWIVQLSGSTADSIGTISEVASMLTGSGVQVEVIRGLGLVGQILVRSEDATADQVSQWFSSLDVISNFEQDIATVFNVVPNDPSYSKTWGMNQIDAPSAWEQSTGSSNIVVGVIDTGVDYNHPDLQANMWVNSGEIAGNGIDDDGNGFVDDVHGYDFVNNDGDPMDDNHHGTHVAGTIAAAGNNSIGVSGVAWNSSIMALKFLSASGAGYTSDAVRAINYATMMRTQYGVDIRVLNNSWGGGGYSSSLASAIEASNQADILFVAAAGNNGTNNDANPQYPANYTSSNVISVAATDSNDNLASFSNYGANTVDVAAPGVGIYSTVIGGSYASFSGTSMAAPHVAGVAALAFALDPTLSAAAVKDAIMAGGDVISGLSGKVLTGSRLNAAATLDLLAPQDDPQPDPEPQPNQAPTIGSVTVSPGTVYLGETDTVTISASSAADSDGTVSRVSFYQDSNNNGVWDASDTQLGFDSSVVGGQASISISNPFSAVGQYRIFARSTDNDQAVSNLVSTTVSVVQPDDHANSASGATLLAIGTTTGGKLNYAGDIDWFRFSVVAGRTYVVDANLDDLSSSAVKLFGSDGVSQLQSSGSNSQFSFTAQSTGVVYVSVGQSNGQSISDYSLNVSESTPFDLQNGHLKISGTAGNDSIIVRRLGSQISVNLNGTTSQFGAAEVSRITFDGSTGTDSATFFGTSGRESWFIEGTTMRVYGTGIIWSTQNTENNTAIADSLDYVRFQDTVGNDQFTASGGTSVMTGAGYKNEAVGAYRVTAISSRGGFDQATLEGTTGNDYFIGRGQDAYMYGSGSYASTVGFDATIANSIGGRDQAYLYDSAGNDTLVASGSTATLSGSDYSNTVNGFARVSATAASGGRDTAEFRDTNGDDVYIARGDMAYMYGSGYFNLAQGFDQSQATSSGQGNDRVMFYDTIGNDTFVARSTESRMAGTTNGKTYQNSAKGFEHVYAIANSGGYDTAYFFDSVADDNLTANSSYVLLQGDDSTNYATGFDNVKAFSSSGSDRLYVGSVDFLMEYFGNWED